MSTNKVYGDAPNELPLVETGDALGLRRPRRPHGIAETCRIDRCLHSLFGASKVAADVMVQEYGRYFGMKTGCFRGGCLTGPAPLRRRAARLPRLPGACVREGRHVQHLRLQGQAGARQHPRARRVHGVRGLRRAPARGEVYNLGGGRDNSVLDARGDRRASRSCSGEKLAGEYVDQNRVGDHICYITRRATLRRPGRGSGRPAQRVSCSQEAVDRQRARR